MATDFTPYKEKLEAELKLLETELARVGRKNPDIAGDWEPRASSIDMFGAEEEERAGEIADFSENAALEVELELQLNKVKAALSRIVNGGYGVCTVCGQPIEVARLMVSPTATTCIVHREQE